jgi:hypothetical protein
VRGPAGALTETLILEGLLREHPGLATAAVVLVGSRAHGHADRSSDWDLVALVGDDREDETIELFPPTEPLAGPTLAAVTRWRASRRFGGVEVEVLGARGRRRRESIDIAVWAFELSHAKLLQDGWTEYRRYAASVADRFAEARPKVAVSEWAHFRLARNETLSAIAHGDAHAATLASARAVQAAARAFLLWAGLPYPSDKWLLTVVRERGGGDLASAAERVLDGSGDAEERFAAVHELARALEAQMSESGADWDELGDWWLRL